MKDVVVIKNLRKSFGPVEVLKGIDLSFRQGEIHAFLGANGAGKSTLLGCLSGAVAPSSGEIYINGRSNTALTPRLSREQGVGIIYQHFQVIEGLSVADNIFLGCEIRRFGVVDSKEQNRISAQLLSRLGFSIDPRLALERLSVGERQLVEIARALHLKPEILILDEPTAALSGREMAALHKVVRQLAKQENLAIVYVTHLIDEVEQIADTVSILRDGNVIWTRPVAEATHQEVARAIAPNMAQSGAGSDGASIGEVALSLRGYCSDYTGPVDLDLHKGEVVGIYGPLGSGRTDLLESLAGARGHTAGTLHLDGKEIEPRNPRHALDLGLALVASDRAEQSLFGELSALDNLLMPHLRSFAGNRSNQRRLFDESAARLQLKPNNPDLPASRFSGGNAQKIVMGRWLFPGQGVRVLLLDEPTQGVDIGAREELYRLLRLFLAEGGAVLVASSDPDEIVALANRVIIIGHGRHLDTLDSDITEERLVNLAHKSADALGATETSLQTTTT